MAQNWPSKQNKADYYQSSGRCERVLRNVNFCKKSVRANMPLCFKLILISKLFKN